MNNTMVVVVFFSKEIKLLITINDNSYYVTLWMNIGWLLFVSHLCRKLRNNLVLLVGVVEVELRSAQSTHYSIEDSELSSSKGSNHDTTGQKSNCAKVHKSNLLGNVHQTDHHGTISSSTLLVNLGKKGISRVRNNGSGNSGNDTRHQGHSNIGSTGKLSGCLAHGSIDGISGRSLHGELSHGVRDLFGKDGEETRIKSTNSLGLQNLSKSIGKTVAELGVRHGTDTHGLQGTEENISNGLSNGGRCQVNWNLVVPCLFLSQGLNCLNFEEFYSTEFEPALDEVSKSSGTETGGKSHGSLLGNNLTHTTDEAGVVPNRVELHACFNNVDGTEGSVGDGAADTTGGGTLEVVHQVMLDCDGGGGEEGGSGNR